MKSRWAILTGVAGGIGVATAAALRAAGYMVLGLDNRRPPADICDVFLLCELSLVGSQEKVCQILLADIQDQIGDGLLALLVNNAAVQHLGRTGDLSWSDWTDTFHVNLSAPFMLVRGLLPKLKAARGVVVNIGSVHAHATKPGFAAYATSKAAVHGLTRALAVDVGPEVRVVCLAPAAIDTPMLRAGFKDNHGALESLRNIHPAGRIGHPEEVAQAVVWLASPEAAFMTGSILWLDGGVLSRLHDVE